MPSYYTGDNVTLGVRAFVEGRPLVVSSGTIDVWDSTDTQRVTAAAVTTNGNTATYQVGTGVTNLTGLYKYEFILTLADGLGQRTYQGTFTVTARYP